MNLNEIKISGDSVQYGDAIIRTANISRMYIVKFFNQRRKQYLDELAQYEDRKRIYEIVEEKQKNTKVRICACAAIVLALFAFLIWRSAAGREAAQTSMVICIGTAVLCGLIALFAAQKDTTYHEQPPMEEAFPDRHGLFIELNSGKNVIFAAEDEIGKQSLRVLRDMINDAVREKNTAVFHMTENHISVENNDGIISTGNDAENAVYEGAE